jgi:hypothetical protein
VLSPAVATIITGGSQFYTAEGFDIYGNSRGIVTSTTIFTIAPDGSCTLNSCTATIPGTHTVTGTKDGKTGTATLNVQLKVGGILQPVYSSSNPLDPNLSAFKIKSVIPIKFRLYTDAGMTQLMTSPPAGSVAKLTLFKYDSTTDTSDPADFVSAGTANTDSIFRWTGSSDFQYIYNLATTGKAQGTYYVVLTLYASDGTTVLAQSAKQFFVLKP